MVFSNSTQNLRPPGIRGYDKGQLSAHARGTTNAHSYVEAGMFRFATLMMLISMGRPAVGQPGPGQGRCCMAGGQPQSSTQAPVASNAVVEFNGVVAKVQIAAGQGMPSIEVKHDGETTVVFLGPMHYLISQDFSPKAGQEVAVKGYKQTNSVIAIQVALPQEKKTLKLRDDNGWPLWRGGPWRGGRGRMMGWQRNPQP